MFWSWVITLTSVAITLCFPLRCARGGESSDPEAAQLVRRALEAEVQGLAQERQTLINEALSRAPDYGPARWHGGYVQIDGRWMTPEAASEEARRNPRLLRYRSLRRAAPGTASHHMDLARWCRRNGLESEARAHWFRVLQFQPTNEEALKQLGLQWYRGELLTHEAAKQRRHQLQDARRATQHWRPIVASWRKTIESGDSPGRRTALDKLRSLTDPAAIPALEQELSAPQSGSETGELSLEVVTLLGEMPSPEATRSLVRHAVLAPWSNVRAAAADQLKRRPLRSYVSQLLSGMVSPIELTSQIAILPNGVVDCTRRVWREGPLADNSLVLRRKEGLSIRRIRPGPARDKAAAERLQSASARAERAKLAVAEANAKCDHRNRRINDCLTRVTGVCGEPKPRFWWDWWADVNELYRPEVRPVRGRSYLLPSLSCFPRGTRVWTLTGPVFVESIRIGDRVLAQDPDTGQLAYKPVLATTLRPPSPMLRLIFGSNELVTTLGHPFWVVGNGWRMAKHLQSSDRIHGVSGSVHIDRIEEAATDEAYNLVVDDFHDYFVGIVPVLVHDNTARPWAESPLPGLPPK